VNLHPFDEVAENAHRKMLEGWTIHQQFNCAHCGVKQTIAEKNRFFTRGKCEECGKETNLKKNGCNFMAISSERIPKGLNL
jgi:zona occludens toxin (predicted ATPase)